MEPHDDNFETASIDYSNEIDEKEENNCYSGNSVFNSSEISTIRQPLDKSDATDNGNVGQMDDMLIALQEIKTQIKNVSKKQKKIEGQINAAMSINSSSLCSSLEPVLMSKS